MLVDEHAPASQRYKLYGELKAGPDDHKHSKALAVSADGIHWDVSKFAGSSAELDRHGTHNNLVFDPKTQRYAGFGRPSNSPFRIEGVSQSLTADFLGKWEASKACGLEVNETKEAQPDALVVMSEQHAGIWLGYANMLHVTEPTAAISRGTTEVELCWSHDLLHWHYVRHGTPFIKRGPQGSYDCCEIFGAKQQPVIEGDTMKIFYAGGNGPFMGSRAAGFSVATLQRDWWFGYTPTQGATSAKVVTTQVQVGSAGTLLVSADARKGAVTVGVVTSPAVSKLSAAECVPLRGNLTDGVVSWEKTSVEGPPLAGLVGKNVSLEFVLQPGAVLFAFNMPDLPAV